MFEKKICDICKKRLANHFYQQIINGQSMETYYCDECADIVDKNYNVFWSSQFDDIRENNQRNKIEKKRCKCGSTEEDIISTGRFGCSECYNTFSDIVNRYVQRLGGKTYSGTMPKNVSANAKKELSPEEKIASLKKELEIAISNRDQKKANEISNQIIEIEIGMKGGNING